MTRNEFNSQVSAIRRKLQAVPAQQRRVHHAACEQALDLAVSFSNKVPEFAKSNLAIAQFHAARV